jgi:membrane protein implicated in regulation of membrane protease activity
MILAKTTAWDIFTNSLIKEEGYKDVLQGLMNTLEIAILGLIIGIAIGTIIALLTIRPLVYKIFYNKTQEIKTNAEAIIGRRAITTERIEGELHPGRVKVDGDEWKAISLETAPIEVGEAVEITALNSIIVTVKKL